MKKSDENKENIENVMNVWNVVGLRMEKKNNVYEVRFNKISVQEPDKWFCVKFTHEDDNTIKIVECEPKDCVDDQLIQREFGLKSQISKPDLRHLIVLIRHNLKKN